jgi:hypothetical protein
VRAARSRGSAELTELATLISIDGSDGDSFFTVLVRLFKECTRTCTSLKHLLMIILVHNSETLNIAALNTFQEP